AGTAYRHRNGRKPGQRREPCGAVFEFVNAIVAEAMSFGEDAQVVAHPRDLDRLANLSSAGLAVDDHVAAVLHRIPNQGNLEQLLLGDKSNWPGHVSRNREDVEKALMVAD